jgi:hypothetical protein
MTFFASDELAGRETGTNQNDVAAMYLKTNAMKLGLKPAPGAEDYFQKIPLAMTKTDKKNSWLKINNSRGETIFSTDSLVALIRPLANTEYTGKLVFAGYGYADGSTGYNDLNGIDFKDKAVLVMTGRPDTVKSDNSEFFNEAVEGIKIMSLITGGAQAILLVYDPMNRYKDAYASGLAEILSSNSVTFRNQPGGSLPAQIIFITQNAANELLKPAGSSLKQMREQILSTGKPVSAELQDITVAVKTSLEKKEFYGSNVIGIVEGSDPVLKNECIIYTAHFDHVGISENGVIFNGADDNASGSMALLEVAEAFMKLRKKPLRTLVFAWVNGEEKGLLGSRYYVDNPVIPLEKTVANINLDMVGRSKMATDTGKLYGMELNITQPDEILVYTAHESSELLEIMRVSARESGIKVNDMGRNIPQGSSDHAPFRDKGIPALCFHSGVHADLHGQGDDIDKIDYRKMEKSSRLAFLIGYKVANQKNRIVIDKQDK